MCVICAAVELTGDISYMEVSLLWVQQYLSFVYWGSMMFFTRCLIKSRVSTLHNEV